MSSNNNNKPVIIPPKDSCHSYLIAISIAFCQAEIMGLYATMPVFLKAISDDPTLGNPTEATLAFAQSVVMLIMPFSGMLAGYVTDRAGARVSLFIASVGAILGPLLFAFSSEVGSDDFDPSTHRTRLGLMISSYGITLGFLALGFMTAPGPAIIGSWFSDDVLSFGVGIGECGVAAGTAIMPLTGGLLLRHFDPDEMQGSWRSAMKLLSVFGVIPLVLSFVTTQRPHDEDDENSSTDEKEPVSTDDEKTNLIKGNETNSNKVTYSVIDSSIVCPDKNQRTSVNEDPRYDNNNKNDDPSSILVDSSSKTDQEEELADSFKQQLMTQLKTPAFIVLFASQFLFGFSYFQFIFCAVPYAKIMGGNNTIYSDATSIDQTDASALMTPFGITSALGALVFGALASKLNNRVVLGASTFVGGILVSFVVPVLRTYAELAVVYAIIGAIAASALTTLPAMVVESFISTPHLINSIMSVSYAGFGIAGAIAPPVSSAIQESKGQNGSYEWSFFIGGLCMLIMGVYHLVVEIRRKFCEKDTNGDNNNKEDYSRVE